MTTVQIAVIQPLGVGKWAGSCRDKHRGAGKFCCPFFFPSASNFPFKKKTNVFLLMSILVFLLPFLVQVMFVSPELPGVFPLGRSDTSEV